MKLLSLRSTAVCSLLLLLQQSLTSLVKSETSEIDATVSHHRRVVTVPAGGPKILCPGIEFKQYAKNTPEALEFNFLNLNESIPLKYVDVHFKVIDDAVEKRFRGMKGIRFGPEHVLTYHHEGKRLRRKELVDMMLREPQMGELVNKRMRQVRVTRGERRRGATQAFKYITQRLRRGERVIYNLTYSDSVECDSGPYEYNPRAYRRVIRYRPYRVRPDWARESTVKRWLREAGAPRLPCPGIQYEQSVRKTPNGLLFEFKNFNKTIELHLVDVHYRIEDSADVPTAHRRLRGDALFGTQINKRMSEVKNKFRFRGAAEDEAEDEIGRRDEASQVFQHLIEHLQPGQVLRYNVTYSNAVECDIGEFTYKETGDQFYRPPIRRYRRLMIDEQEPIEDEQQADTEEFEEPVDYKIRIRPRVRYGIKGQKMKLGYARPLRYYGKKIRVSPTTEDWREDERITGEEGRLQPVDSLDEESESGRMREIDPETMSAEEEWESSGAEQQPDAEIMREELEPEESFAAASNEEDDGVNRWSRQ